MGKSCLPSEGEVAALYHCPKEGQIELHDTTLAPGLVAHECPSCGGAWIPPDHYADWQQQQGHAEEPIAVTVAPMSLDVPFQPAASDNRAGLCPECKHYLVRGRINLKSASFFVERCPNCQGIWCDQGEWDMLEKLDLASHIEYIFTTEWQTQVRILENAEREKQATIEKLGPEVAARVFELAEVLENHPNGDFGVAYLMRRFDQ